MRSEGFEEIAGQIAALHGAAGRCVYAFAGAGSLALYWLHAVAGSSRTVLEGIDCYAPASLASLVGREVARAVSEETAREMARAAFRRAVLLDEPGALVFGLSCTAALSTDRARRGSDRGFVAVATARGLWGYGLHFGGETRERLRQEESLSRLVLRSAGQACGASVLVSVPLGEGDVLELLREEVLAED
jgi:nicotinamide mononucleotide (NMN) deamidase PncC